MWSVMEVELVIVKETIVIIYNTHVNLLADFSAKAICVTLVRNIAHIFLILACKTCHKYNQGHGKRKPLLLVSLRLWCFFFFGPEGSFSLVMVFSCEHCYLHIKWRCRRRHCSKCYFCYTKNAEFTRLENRLLFKAC